MSNEVQNTELKEIKLLIQAQVHALKKVDALAEQMTHIHNMFMNASSLNLNLDHKIASLSKNDDRF